MSVYLSPCLAGSVRLFDVCLHLSRSLAGHSFVSHSGSWLPALRMSVFTCLSVWLVVSGSLDVCPRLSPSMCLPAWLVASGSADVCLHVSPSMCLPVSLVAHGSPDVFLHLSPFISLPIWLVVSGSLDVRLLLLGPKQKPAMTHMTTLQPLISNTCSGKDCLFASKVLPQIVSEVVQMQIGQNRLNSYLRTV